jgi:L-amino acid N-acyltransferase YncA
MSPDLRDTVAADLTAITAIYADEVLHGTATFELTPPDEAEMASRLAAVRALDLPWLTAEVDGAVVGYAYLSPFRLRPAYRYCAELSVYIAPEARGRGIGRALMEALIARARARGLRHLLGAIGDSANIGSIALHRAAGFQEVGVWRETGWKFERWIDVVLMQLDLAPGASRPGPRACGFDAVARPAGRAYLRDMVILRTLLMLAGALAVLTLGALPAAAGPATPPCHDMSGQMHHGDQPAQTPSKAIKVMACCVMCVAAPALPPIQPAAAPSAARDHHASPAARMTGCGPAPEHGPPRA